MEETTVTITSTHDGAGQKMRYIRAAGKNRPLVVALHTWSFDYTQDCSEYFRRCADRGWHCIFPDFRGPNRTPLSCGSPAALADVRDALDWGIGNLSVDHRRVFLAGVSGGGHMALLTAGTMPSLWTAVSAWVPISDLARWHRECTERGLEYSSEMETICGGAPGTSFPVDRNYRSRSPIDSLWRAHIVPVDINVGIHDGHGGKLGGEGSVPVGQSIRAYNELVVAAGKDLETFPEEAIEYIEKNEKVPDWCDPGDTNDPAYDRRIHLRRTNALARLTLFEGGHEILCDAAFRWFDSF
jgi:acetyl esterase/lipase